MKRLLPTFVLLALCPLPAHAHEFWLTPSSYAAAKGDTISIACYVGTGFRGERKPYASPRTIGLTLRTLKNIDLTPATTNGDIVYARFIAPDDGGALVAYQSNFTPIELPAPEFDAYLKLEGLDEPLAARAKLGDKAGKGRERYARCPKTWIAGRDAQRVLAPVGLPLEIVPLADPTAGATLSVRVLYHGKPLPNALVRGWNEPFLRGFVPRDAADRDSVGPSTGARTNRDGVATLDVTRAGEWMVSATHMVPSENRNEADWQSLWASLTFARPGKRP